MTTNEIVGRLKAGGLDASSTNRNAAVYVTEARSGRAEPGWFGFRIVCDSEATERRVRAILSRWYDIDANGNVWRLKSKNRVPLMAIKRGVVPPTPPTPTDGPMYFEAVEANSTVSMMSTLATAPDLEYSTDGVTWQEWQHTTQEIQGVILHIFDTLTLSEIGDKIYIKGDNPNGMSESSEIISVFGINGLINAGGMLVSIIDSTMQMTTLPPFAFNSLFLADSMTGLNTAPSLDNFTVIGEGACELMFAGQPLNNAADMSNELTIGNDGLKNMYYMCTFAMSDDGTTLNFDFPTPPVTVGEETYNTYYDLAAWMGNTNGFNEP